MSRRRYLLTTSYEAWQRENGENIARGEFEKMRVEETRAECARLGALSVELTMREIATSLPKLKRRDCPTCGKSLPYTPSFVIAHVTPEPDAAYCRASGEDWR